MNRFPAAACSFVLVALMAGTLHAGALDRQNTQPRSNPVTQSMIRVPGVVGQDQGPAMMAVQAAGLNVTVKEAKKMPKGMEGAAGMEGKVVTQTPTAGGMAMYGTTVTIEVWKPGQSAPGTGTSTGGSSWGTGTSTPSYGGQSSYGSSAGTMPVQSQPYLQGGTMGGMQMQGQGGQGFQVQQYYFPGGGSGGQAQPQVQQPTDPQQPMQPTDPYSGQQGVPPQGVPPQPQVLPAGQ
jgi:hypothetical protein